MYMYTNTIPLAEVLNIIRHVGKDTETIDVIYVINKHGELLDDIRIQGIFTWLRRIKKVSEMMDGQVY